MQRYARPVPDPYAQIVMAAVWAAALGSLVALAWMRSLP
jgi:hypothetical protein